VASQDVDETIAQLFHEHARPLIRLARLFADDRKGAYVLLTLVFELPEDWAPTVGGAQVKVAMANIAGILLIMGVLHSLNLVRKTQADSGGTETRGGSS